MATTVYFRKSRYGNYLDHYYTDDYASLMSTLQAQPGLTWSGNLGIIDGITVVNKFEGDFTQYNCAIVEHATYGTHLYKIISKKFLRKNQWQIMMQKDIVSANWNGILSSKILSERLGIRRDIMRPILYQQEAMNFSEVLKGRIELNELPYNHGGKTYGFLLIWSRDSLNGSDVEWTSETYPSHPHDLIVNTIDELPFYLKTVLTGRSRSLGRKQTASPGWNWNASVGHSTQTSGRWFNVSIIDNGAITTDVYTDNFPAWPQGPQLQEVNGSLTTDVLYNNFITYLMSKTSVGINVPNWQSYVGKIVYETSTGRYYEISQGSSVHNESLIEMTVEEVKTILQDPDATRNSVQYPGCVMITDTTTLNLTQLPVYENPQKHTFGIYKSLLDQPFKMMYVPMFENYGCVFESKEYTTNYNHTIKVLTDLISKYSGDAGKLLDVQLVPYCPIDGLYGWYSETNQKFMLPDNQVKDSIIVGNLIVPFFEVQYASFYRNIGTLNGATEIAITDYKVQEKDKYMFSSPSGANNWEFNIAKNGGLFSAQVKVDLRPYASYYQLQPEFGDLYGWNETDTRGLVWQEDSSITMVTSAWETYKRQNINYMNSFNSDVEYSKSTLKLTHDTNKGNFWFDAGKHMIEAGVESVKFAADQVADDVWFGAKGGIAGGVGAAAILAGQAGMEAVEGAQMLYNNAQDLKRLELDIGYKKQQFNYSLDNIRAIPENTSKVSGIFNTNNMTPYILVYGPTSEEINYFQTYLDEFGISCGMMINLLEYTSELYYLKGTLIRLNGETTNEEYQTINQALSMGVRKFT